MDRLYYLICLIWVLTFTSCRDSDNKLLSKLDQIYLMANVDYEYAGRQLDSLTLPVRDASDYVRNRYDLMEIRLKDKADKIPSSDHMILRLADYFEKCGDERDKQVVYYYAGSVYRDLSDTPRSVYFFLKSDSVAIKSAFADSLLLRNTYSNLYFLLHQVQDYERALKYAKKEYNLSESLHSIDSNTLNHLGMAYVYLNKRQEARKWFDKELELIRREKPEDYRDPGNYSDAVLSLLFNYAYLGDKDKADECYQMSQKLTVPGRYTDKNIVMAEYFKLVGQVDSCILCYNKILDDDKNDFSKYDATKNLFQIYYNQGDYERASEFARHYVQVSESIDFGKRQSLAATVNNQFQYHFDESEEIGLKKDNKKQRHILTNVVISTILLIIFSVIVLSIRRIKIKNEFDKLRKTLKDYKEEIKNYNEALEHKKNIIDEKRTELQQKQTKIEELEHEIKEDTFLIKQYQKEVELQKERLSEQMSISRSFSQFISEAMLEQDAEDVVNSIKEASKGKKNLSATEWKSLYKAVNTLYPDFKTQITLLLDNLSEQQVRLCYLLKIGLLKHQICNIMEISRSTLWRMEKELKPRISNLDS